jgi:hypothetical protein
MLSTLCRLPLRWAAKSLACSSSSPYPSRGFGVASPGTEKNPFIVREVSLPMHLASGLMDGGLQPTR